MVKCEYCNVCVDETAGICPHCGAPLPTQTQQTQEQEQAQTATNTAASTAAEQAASETTETGATQTTGAGTATAASVGAGILGGIASLFASKKKKEGTLPPPPEKPPVPKMISHPDPRPGRPVQMHGRGIGPGVGSVEHRTAPGGSGPAHHGERLRGDGNRHGGPGARR